MFGTDFYPTPKDLIDKMLDQVDMDRVEYVLEPSAGRGDIIERIKEREPYPYRTKQIDAIEDDSELCMVLEGKGYKPVARDFLEFNTFRQYDLIIMNPPFSDGDKHLLKAIRLQRGGGQVVCLLNAETIKNPYTNTRKELVAWIEMHGATVEYIADAFTSGARTTGVETALVYCDIPVEPPKSDILKNLVEARELENAESDAASEVVEGDYIRGAVKRYEIEVATGLKFIDEYDALKPLLSKSFTDKGYSMIELTVDGERYGNNRNVLVNRTRMKYWQELFQTREFGGLFTSKTQEDYQKRIDDLGRYEFNIRNIKQMQLELSQSMLGSLDDMIVRLFDEFSNQYYDEQSNNIHYYNGWKTNKAYVVNKKVITRMYAYNYGSFDIWRVREKMADIHKVFSYLEGTLSNKQDGLWNALSIMESRNGGQTQNVNLPYCTLSVYKKGTAHITFRDLKLLKKFNLIGSQRKGWLPPDYGKKSYTDMSEESRAVVDEFEGPESYADTFNNSEFYLSNAAPVLEIGSGMGVAA